MPMKKVQNGRERDWFPLLSSYIGRVDKAVLEQRLAFDFEFTQSDLERVQKQVDIDKLSEKYLG